MNNPEAVARTILLCVLAFLLSLGLAARDAGCFSCARKAEAGAPQVKKQPEDCQLAGAPGFWVPREIFIELEATFAEVGHLRKRALALGTATVALDQALLAGQRAQLMCSVRAEGCEAAFEKLHGRLLACLEQARPSLGDSPVLWSAIGCAACGALSVGVAATYQEVRCP